ncbi:Transcription factor TFIIB repeat-containing protein [Halopenitus malekzadehii]|uniref:Transcription factor TFIIB repeat-containing protein n=1 Tax=Halopenitus malekzadehii TaxID=1267564 RepID=A0A1H6IKI4_9EURY|nr:cyclin [Halopenitus malekzadehii]SEH46904.1 Transcription factor TFIIB repeat-containing protein [Halopenitus malekzadehii]
MYRASDHVANEEWIDRIDEACATLDLGDDVRSTAVDLFLSNVPDADRSKATVAAASLYAAALIHGQERPQSAVADAMSVTRLSVHTHWKDVLEEAGFTPPSW